MSKFKNFTKKPITWGGYFKLCGASVVLSVLMYVPMMIYYRKQYKDLM